jgi:hypothetical protein
LRAKGLQDFVFHLRYFLYNEIKKDEVDWVCSTHQIDDNLIKEND